jgi:hypothetical protein
VGIVHRATAIARVLAEFITLSLFLR